MADKKETLGEAIGFPGSKPKKDSGEGMLGAIKRRATSWFGGDSTKVPAAEPSSYPSSAPSKTPKDE